MSNFEGSMYVFSDGNEGATSPLIRASVFWREGVSHDIVPDIATATTIITTTTTFFTFAQSGPFGLWYKILIRG